LTVFSSRTAGLIGAAHVSYRRAAAVNGNDGAGDTPTVQTPSSELSPAGCRLALHRAE
jgi:hypothetical protein